MVDVNTPVTNPLLKELIHKLNTEKTEEAQNLVLEEIALNAHFLSIVVFSPSLSGDYSDNLTLEKNTMIQFSLLATVDDRVLYPMFTDWEELRKWGQEENPQTLILTFDDYVEMVRRDETIAGVVINPFGEGLPLDRKLLEHMKMHKDIIVNGSSEQKVEKDTEVLLGEPKEYPTPMVNAIFQYLKTNKNVRAAWLRLMMKADEQSFLLIIDFQGEKDPVFGAIAAVAKPYLNGMYLDMVPLNTDFGRNAVSDVEPFYRRKKVFFGLR